MSPVAEAPKNVRMTLINAEFLSEYGGHCPAGTVVPVDEDTASRWLAKGIARPSAETDKTLREQKLDELARLQAEIEAIPENDPGFSPVTRSGGAPNTRAVRR